MKYFQFLLWIWEAPQCLAGLLCLAAHHILFKGRVARVGTATLWVETKSRGLCLGEVVFAPRDLLAHELGHTRQSRFLGVFYLLAVGIPSAFRYMRYRSKKRTLGYARANAWYLSGYPESWAERLKPFGVNGE